ncbi:hypothetical protein BDN72DRAFT_899311, partial [Pluteus cervinus]
MSPGSRLRRPHQYPYHTSPDYATISLITKNLSTEFVTVIPRSALLDLIHHSASTDVGDTNTAEAVVSPWGCWPQNTFTIPTNPGQAHTFSAFGNHLAVGSDVSELIQVFEFDQQWIRKGLSTIQVDDREFVTVPEPRLVQVIQVLAPSVHNVFLDEDLVIAAMKRAIQVFKVKLQVMGISCHKWTCVARQQSQYHPHTHISSVSSSPLHPNEAEAGLSRTMDKGFKAKHSDPLLAEQKRILKRIRKLHRRIHRLKTWHNELAPINRLPPELLIRIFFGLQSNFLIESAEKYYAWIVVTHVSRSWRALALETKQLWSGISQTMEGHELQSILPWGAMSVERSIPSKLDVAVTIGPRRALARIPAVFDQIHRIRTLQIKISGTSCERNWRLRQIIDWLRKTEAPVLEEFILEGSNIFEGQGSHTPADHSINTLFHSTAPRLRYFRINAFDLTLGTMNFQGITVLILRHAPGYHGLLSFRALFDFLSITRLNTLELQNALVDGDVHNEDDDPTPIHLPSLSTLLLYLPTHQCQRFLNHVVLPPSCEAAIWGHSTFNPDDIVAISPQEFLASVHPHFSHDPAAFTGRLTIKLKTDTISLCLRRKTNQGGHSVVLISFISQSLALGLASGNWVSCPNLSVFSNVPSVKLEGSPHSHSITATISDLSRLPSLRKIHMESPFITSISDHINSYPTSFPDLVRLSIILVDKPPHSFDLLERALATRKKAELNPISLDLTGTRGWTEKKPFVEVLKRLRDVGCDLSVFNSDA